MRSRSDLLLVLGFGAALLAPALAWRLDPAAWRSLERENRNPAPFPEPPRELAEVPGFPPAFERWQADTLGLREPLLRANNLLAYALWDKLPSPTLLFGRSGWIFYTGEDSRAVWRGLYPVPREFAANWLAALRSRAAWCERRGIAYLYVVAPNKESVYPDELPASETALGPTLLDLLADEFAAHPELPCLDLRAALALERAHDRPEAGDYSFHPLGTHWTARAAWSGTQAIVARLAELHPELAFPPEPARAECELAESADANEDTWASSLRLEQVCTQRVWDFRARAPQAEACTPGTQDLHARECLFERPDAQGERVLLVHDSFGPWAREPLAERSARLLTLWSEELPLARIEAEHPRVVIEMRTERRLRDAQQWLYDPLEALLPGTCEALAPLEPLPAGADSLQGVAGFAGSRIAPDAASGGVRVLSPDGNARVRLDGWRTLRGERLALRLVLRSPAATEARVWYQTRADPRFHPRRYQALLLQEGRNELCLRFPEADIAGPLLFQPGAAPGEYVIERLEGRSGR